MKRPYRIVHDTSTASSRELADWLAKDGRLLVPLVELLEKGERAIDEVIDALRRAPERAGGLPARARGFGYDPASCLPTLVSCLSSSMQNFSLFRTAETLLIPHQGADRIVSCVSGTAH